MDVNQDPNGRNHRFRRRHRPQPHRQLDDAFLMSGLLCLIGAGLVLTIAKRLAIIPARA